MTENEKMKDNPELCQKALQVVELAPVILYQYSLSPDGTQKLLFISKAIEPVLKVPAQSLMDHYPTFWSFIVKDDVDRVYESISVSYQKLKPWICEFRILTPDHQMKWIHGESVPSEPLPDGTVIWNGAFLDITERKRIEDELKNYRVLLEEMVRARTIKLEDEFMERQKIESALRSSEDKFGAVFDQVFQFIWFLDLEGRLIQANRPALDFAGVTLEAIAGKPFWLTPWWRHAPQIQEQVEAVVARAQKGEFVRFEGQASSKDGKLILLDLSFKPMKDAQGTIIGVIPEGRDLTDFKALEQKIFESKELLELQIHRMPIGCITLSQDFKIASWNPAAQEIFGYRAEEVLGKSPYEVIVPKEVQPKTDLIWHRLLEGDDTACIVNENVTKTGRRIICDWRNTPLKSKDGTVFGALSMVQDITDRRTSEELIRIKNEELDMAVRSANMGVWRLDVKTGKRHFDRQVCRLIGINPESFTGEAKEFFERIHPDDREKIHAALSKTLSEGASYDIEYRAIWDDKSVHYLKAQGKLIRSHDVPQIIGIIWDITERRRIEDELKRAMAIRARFTAIASHELRTPLSAMHMGIETVLDGIVGEVSEAQKEMLLLVKRNIDRLARLVNNILSYEALKSGKMSFVMEENSIEEVVQDVYTALDWVAQTKKLKISVLMEPNLPKMLFDKDRITEVMMNLVSNAVKFTQQGSIEIHVDRQQAFVHVAVKDTGIGIREEDQGKLFEYFRQLNDSEDQETPGSGLGLVISKEIVLKHQGNIWAESVYQKGSVFHVLLPIHLTSV